MESVVIHDCLMLNTENNRAEFLLSIDKIGLVSFFIKLNDN